MKITFIGHGYVGLVTASVFADLGNTVWVIGHTKEKIANLQKGVLPIYEPGLEEMVKRNVKANRLLFTLDYEPAIANSDVIFIAVGTPPKANGEADLSVVFEVAKKIGEKLQNFSVVVTKSTVPVGTSETIIKIIKDAKIRSAEFEYASVPEFLREGQAINDTLHPDRVVIGTNSKKARDLLIKLHKPIIEELGDYTEKVVLTSIPTAEMIKYASNAYLATKISFANAIAQLSEKVGANGVAVLGGIGLDKRIGNAFLNPGAGYGGSCFPKDVKALIAIAKSYGYDFNLLKEVEKINSDASELIVKKAEKLLGNLDGKNIGILGLSFKPDTDDMRDAPSILIVNQLLRKGGIIKAYDPIAISNAKKILNNITFASDAYEAVKNTDLLIIVTEWNEFKELDILKLKKLMRTPNLIDGRNIYNPKTMQEAGFTYIGVGQ